jgi:hypothetical protein
VAGDGGGVLASLSVLWGQGSISAAAVELSVNQAFRHGILILTVPAVLFFSAICLFAIRKLSQSVESEETSASSEEADREAGHS